MTRSSGLILSLLFGCLAASAQTTILTCAGTATPPLIRGEGLTERLGDIVMSCSGGTPRTPITGNLTVFFSVPITNRVNSNNVTDAVLTVDSGAGPQPAGVPGALLTSSSIAFNGLSFTLSPAGTVVLRLSNVRANVAQSVTGPNGVFALLSFSPGNSLPVPNNQFAVGYPTRGLYAGFSGKIICSPRGSPFPNDPTSFASFIASNAVFASTRVTEGFADAFNPRNTLVNFNADSGQRIIARYSGFPAGARLFVPDVVAGSNAVQPTAGGDFGLTASGGKYAPGGNGSLLLARVRFADANGVGGQPAYLPGAPGSATVSFDSMNEVTLSNGSGYVVYEVVDANPFVPENAQFPTFLVLPPSGGGDSVTTSESVSFAPVSNVGVATSTDPIPRFVGTPAPSDCNVVGDCGASYFPVLFVDTTPLQFAAQAGTGHQVKYFIVNNRGGGLLSWNASVTYKNSSGWLQLTPTSGLNNGTVRVDAVPGNLAPGTYNAVITVDAGPVSGTQTIPVTFVVSAGAPPAVPPPSISSVVNAASFAAGPVVPGSLTSVMGARLSGKNVAVTFDGTPAQVLFGNDSQLNVVVPAELAAKSTAQLVVTVDGVAAASQSVSIAPFAPAIFKGAVLNQDYTVNGSDHPAASGSVIQIFATGLSGNGLITAQLGGQTISAPYYAGPAPGLPGVQQIDVQLPGDLTGTTANVAVCGASVAKSDQPVCSAPAPVALVQ